MTNGSHFITKPKSKYCLKGLLITNCFDMTTKPHKVFFFGKVFFMTDTLSVANVPSQQGVFGIKINKTRIVL